MVDARPAEERQRINLTRTERHAGVRGNVIEKGYQVRHVARVSAGSGSAGWFDQTVL